MQSNERLLKLYESGLPAWAIYMPLYRPAVSAMDAQGEEHALLAKHLMRASSVKEH